MKITDDTDLLVGEYVLGTLERDERRKLEEIAAREPTVAAAVMVWERRLAPLHELVASVDPPEGMWAKIVRRVADTPQDERHREAGFFEVFHQLVRSHRADSAMHLVDRLRRWRSIAVITTALACAMAAFLVAALLRPPPLPSEPLIGVLRTDAVTPPFIVAADPERRTLTVRTAPGNTADDRSYAFWLLREGEPPAPLGRLRGTGELKTEALAHIDRAALRKATVAVTIEPNGAPADAPTTPFVYRGRFE